MFSFRPAEHELASLHWQAQPWARREAFLAFQGFGFEPGGMSSCAKPPMLCLLRCLARTSTIKSFSIGHVPALAFRAQWFQTARRTCLRKTDSEN